MRSRRLSLGPIAVVAGVLALAGCGGSDNSSATVKWADGVCSAVVDYKNSLNMISAVSTTLLTAQSQIKSAVAELKQLDAKGELQDAFSQASSCDSLSGK